MAASKQLECSDRAGGRRKLNRRKRATAHCSGVNLLHETSLDEPCVIVPDNIDIDNDYIAEGHRHFLVENLGQQILFVTQIQIVQQELHQVSVSRVPQCLVIEFAYPPFESFAHGCCSAGSIEGLVLDAINRQVFDPVQWQSRDTATLVQRFATLAIFVDKPCGAPTQIVFHLVAGREWQGTDAHFY